MQLELASTDICAHEKDSLANLKISKLFSRMGELKEEDAIFVAQLDSGLRCKWSWAWLKIDVKTEVKGVQHSFPLSQYFKKIDKAGFCKCSLCLKEINYSNKGCHALLAHCQTEGHRQKVCTVMTTLSVLPVSKQGAPNGPEAMREKVRVPVSVSQRVANAEAMVLATLAEHSLPFTLAPVMMKLAQALAADKVALSGLKLSRTSAVYKMVHGLGFTFSERIFSNTRKYPFSINLDESTTNGDKKVLTILVSYFNPEKKTVDVEHLGSLEVFRVTALKLEKLLDKFFEDNNIPWSNLVSMLMDSCGVMRGSKTGLETRVRQNHCPTLIDVDGDSCHHIHNAAKVFAAPFSSHLERLFSDLHADHQWATEQLAYLRETCEFMSISWSAPKRFVQHRWLSAYDVAISTQRLLPAYKVLYYGFMDKEDKALYKDPLKELFVKYNVSEKAQAQILSFHKDLGTKGMTELGKDRKKRVIKKVWHEAITTELHLSVYTGVLPILKEYVMVFQGSETLVHKLHDKQLQVFTNFLACFVKSEHLNQVPKTLATLEFDNHLLPLSQMYVGRDADQYRAKHPQHPLLKAFLQKVSQAYIMCAKYLQKKLPLQSLTLQSLSAVDPVVRGHSHTVFSLRKLTEMMGHLLPPDADIHQEILQYNVDQTLPSFQEGDDVVKWWASVFETGKYPTLGHAVKAAMSIFHGPLVESSFNVMDCIIDQRSTSMNISTFSAVQTVKYALLCRKQTAVEMFQRDDVKFGTVDRRLCSNICSAGTRDKAQRHQNILKMKERKVEFGCQPSTSAAESRAEVAKQESVARKRHMAKQRKLAIQRLVQAKRLKK